MKDYRFEWWRSSEYAANLGCTNHARMFRIIPGFWSNDSNLWVSRSDAFNWLEDLLVWINEAIWAQRGEDPQFMFYIGKPIAKPTTGE